MTVSAANRHRDDLFEAIAEGDLASARAALAHDPRLARATDDLGRNALMVAVASPARSLAMIELLLESGVRADWIDPSGMSVLHWATDIAGTGDDLEPLALRLVAAGSPLEHRGPFGWTPLVRAVLSGTAKEVAALVAAGARVDVSLPDGTVPAFARGRTLLEIANADEDKRASLTPGEVSRQPPAPATQPQPRGRRSRRRR